jgi:hypothetical protein
MAVEKKLRRDRDAAQALKDYEAKKVTFASSTAGGIARPL